MPIQKTPSGTPNTTTTGIGADQSVAPTKADPAKAKSTPAVGGGGNPAGVSQADLPTAKPKGGMKVGIPGLAMAAAQKQSAATKPSFELLPGRYPGAVSLPTVVTQVANGPEGQAQLKALIADIEQKTGIKPPPALVQAVLANPTRFGELLVATPAQMSAGVDGLNAAYKAGKLPELPPMAANLPSGFDLANIDKAPVTRPEAVMKELGPGLFQGDIKNDAISDKQAKRNIVMAEVFDRLAGNSNKPTADRFEVDYDGSTFTRLETFLDKLAANGHDVTVAFEHRVANFANLKAQAPDGSFLDVPAALLVRTGIKDETTGQEAVLPAVHSEMVISVDSSNVTKGPKLDAKTKWFQGISGTGFFPAELSQTPRWCGDKTSATLTGDKALEAVHLAGLTSDLINVSAKEQGLAVGGYGATGVCNDSVAVVQRALTGKTAAYPLLMRDGTLMAELQERLSDKNKLDDPEYKAIGAAIKALPSDVKLNDTARERAREGGMPWDEGKEPFQHVVDARQILA